MKKSIKALILTLFLGTFHLSYSQIELDTTGWKLYKDSELLIKSNRGNSIIQSTEIKRTDNFEFLNIMISYNYPKEAINRKIRFMIGNKTIITIKEDAPGMNPFFVPREKIKELFGKYKKKQISIAYFDDVLPNGILIGFIKIIK